MFKGDPFKGSGITFTFEGNYEVDALSVAKAIQSLVEISTISASYNYPDVEFRLSVKAIAPGSLKFAFSAVAQTAQTLLTPENITYSKNLMESVKTAFEIKKMLKGNPPAKVENHENTVTVENAEGQRLTVQTSNAVFLVDQRIDNSICHIVERADELSGVSGISIAHGNKNPVRIPKADFQTFAKKIDISKIEEKAGKTLQNIRKNEILFIRKPDLLGNSQWQFKADTQFQASINDLTFLEQVHSGKQSIAAKMYIVADVLVTMELGEDGLPDEKRQHYSIEKVHSIHTLDDDQMRLS